MTLGNMQKKNFAIIENLSINFKDEVRKLKRVNKIQMAYFECDFIKITEKIQTFWVNINKEIKIRKKLKT